MDDVLDAKYVAVRLEEAGRVLMALPATGCMPSGFRSFWPHYPHDVHEAYGYGQDEPRPAVPSAKAVSAMEQAFGWVQLISPDKIRMRRIVLMRSLVSPRTDRHVWSWRRLAEELDIGSTWARGEYATGLAIIAGALNRPGLCRRSGGPISAHQVGMAQAIRANVASAACQEFNASLLRPRPSNQCTLCPV